MLDERERVGASGLLEQVQPGASDRLEMLLVEHLERTGRSGRDLVFGKDADTPYNANTVHNRARKAMEHRPRL
jgi:hypothetical protein